jgi:hypothetical protein
VTCNIKFQTRSVFLQVRSETFPQRMASSICIQKRSLSMENLKRCIKEGLCWLPVLPVP